MNDFISILIESSVSICLLFIIYWAFLRKDTFFRTNRFYLLLSLTVSLIVPFFDFNLITEGGSGVLMVLLEPVIITPEGIQQSMNEYSNIFQIAIAVYLTGVFIFSMRFFFQIAQLLKLIDRFGISRHEGMRLVFTTRDYAPFSFFNLIFINNADLRSPETRKIIEHESVHIRQWHSLDLLIIELVTIIMWFNPFVWFYRHAVKSLHEYLADEGVLHSGVDVSVYRALVFTQGTGIQINDLTNNFSKSLIKKRFIMMTKKKTNPLARVKLLIALPLALIMMLAISNNSDLLAQKGEKVPAVPAKEISKAETPAQPAPPAPQDDEDPVFTVVEEMPSFPGGREAMFEYLGSNIKYPAEAKKNGTAGTVYVTFVIEKNGKVSNVKILRGVEKSLDSEALRVVKSMPDWTPGKQKGKVVRVQFNLPIKFTLDDGKEKEKQKEKDK